MTQPMPTLPGIPEQIARYRLLSELGRGSMGHVYLALDPNIDRKVALKIFLPLLKVGVAEQWELRQRFVVEARAAGQLSHPGIVTIFDADTDPETGLSYLAMEWVNGPSLDDLIRESGRLSVERSTGIAEEVALALDAAHRQGLVHRDIKPANILLESNGRAKVTDFGIAKLASMSITTTGWIPGSPFFMSPEQIRNERIDRRSDLYALGAVLYQCLTGALPFEAESLAALTHMILEIDPRPVRSINPGVSPSLAAVIERALAKSPDDRFDCGRQFAEALRLAREEKFPATSAGSGTSGARRQAAEALTAGFAARSGTGTIGLAPATAGPAQGDPSLAAGAAASQDDLEAAPPLEEEPEASVAVGLEGPTPHGAREAPGRAGQGRAGLARFLVGIAVVLALVTVLWSLRPVESEPTSDSSAVARLFSLAPRFAADVASQSAPLEVPAEPPGAADPPPAAPVAVEVGSPGTTPAAAPPSLAKPAAKPAASTLPPAESAEGPVAAVEPAAEPAPPEAPPAAPPKPVVRATSTLELVYRNRLKQADLSVSIDGVEVYAGTVSSPEGFYNRTVGKNVWTSVALTPGEHTVDVRITGAGGKLDLVRQTTATFEHGRTHRLRVSVTRLKNLRLSWKESPSG